MSTANPLQWWWCVGDEGPAHGPLESSELAEAELRAELAEDGEETMGRVFQAAQPAWADYVDGDAILDLIDRLTEDDRHDDSRLDQIPRPILEHAAGALRTALAGWAPDWLLARGEDREVSIKRGDLLAAEVVP